MAVFEGSQPEARKVFISYSSTDRVRTIGLGLLLEGLGHQVFHDHRTIKPGSKWQAALQEGLDEADSLMVFWTKHAARSDWVRKEYEYFYATYPDRPLVPVLGDETELTEILKTRQHADFAPIVNEVLQMKRDMKKRGASATEIESAVTGRLADAGIEIKSKKQRFMLFLFLGFGWLRTLLRDPAATAKKIGSGTVEKAAQVTAGQAVAIAAAVAVGLAAVPTAERIAGRDLINLGTGNVATTNGSVVGDGSDAVRPRPGIEFGGVTDSLLAFRSGLIHTQDEITIRLDDIASRLDGLLGGDAEATALAACRREVVSLEGDVETLTAAAVLSSAAATSPDGDTTQPIRPVVSGNMVYWPPAGGDFVPPERISAPEPDVPSWARDREGLVTIEAMIDKEGDVSVQNAVPTRGPDVFGEVARDAVANWKFKPGTLDGQPVPVRLVARVEFVQRR